MSYSGFEGAPPSAVQHATLRLPDRPEAVPLARHFAAERLDQWNVGAPIASDALLLTSELVTNAYRHGAHPRLLDISLSEGRLRLEVEDASDDRPELRAPDPDGEGGRGVALVDRLSAAWGTTYLPESPAGARGKRVWCELSDE